MAKKPFSRKRPDFPMDSPAHERGEGPGARMTEYGSRTGGARSGPRNKTGPRAKAGKC